MAWSIKRWRAVAVLLDINLSFYQLAWHQNRNFAICSGHRRSAVAERSPVSILLSQSSMMADFITRSVCWDNKAPIPIPWIRGFAPVDDSR